MASKLCCTAEQEDRPGSPPLPNARPSGATPAKQPLLPKLPESPTSHFTSFRSDELHELHQIFDHAQDHTQGPADGDTVPSRLPRARFSRASIYSLHSLHKMTSMRSLIRRKFSRDLVRKESAVEINLQATQKVATSDQDTVIKSPRAAAKTQLQIRKSDLRKDLLSDKKPDEGGYDSDAEILDDLAKNIGKKTPSKRASIHSVRWSPATSSKATPDSSTKSRGDADRDHHDIQPYQIQKPPEISLTTRIGHVFSTPNLRVDVSDGKTRTFRRSQSAMSVGLPQVSPLSPLSPLRLPSLTSHDQNGVSWAETINESIRLSQFPDPPHVSTQGSQTLPSFNPVAKTEQRATRRLKSDENASSDRLSCEGAVPSFKTNVQQPASVSSPRPSTSIRDMLQESAQTPNVEEIEGVECEKEDNARHSVHLYSMRISHHLRSGSLLSWDHLSDAPDLPLSTKPYRERTVSDQSRTSHINKQVARHERQTSSSGFTSTKVPYRWGKVLPSDHDVRGDMASSIYSSRPQSPPESFVASLTSLGRMNTVHDDVYITPPHSRSRRSNSFPTDNEETPRAAPLYGPSNLRTVEGAPTAGSFPTAPPLLARKNSVADTKRSKFREDFSPSPPRKKINPSESIVKFLNLKRLSGRSQSEATLIPEFLARSGDAALDNLDVSHKRERQQSQPRKSFDVDQGASHTYKGPERVWDQALKAHQEEKASLFLPINRDLAAHASPFRERSGSIMTRHSATESPGLHTLETRNKAANFFAPTYSPSPGSKSFVPEEPHCPQRISRRSAVANQISGSFDREVSAIFEKQGDGHNIVGAWGQYPSHTRDERTNSASSADRVSSRDFALEAAIQFASAQDVEEDMIDPIGRIPSMPLTPGDKKKKKKLSSGRMTRSNSLTFGKMFLKNYSSIFKSSSTEFRMHGRNHRSSIATGGILQFPELELLPEVGNHGISVDGVSDRNHRRKQSSGERRASDSHQTIHSQTHDSMVTLRPRRNSSAPNLDVSNYDGTSENHLKKENARIWSVYYDDCVPSYPRVSIELNTGKEESGPPRFSFESQHPSMRSRTMPRRSVWHSRNNSRMSYASIISRGSAHPSMKSKDDSDDFMDKRSMVSVRRSTMDLISKFKEQELVEHERVLSMTRAGSHYGNETLAAL
ncbi:hypothetical protein OPT61_g7586 [Boeremia exigua]|uniref:Uncharacterized protein n=1 Tax=Boeremia exigua TaxID=749465 RepID=A0ACC2I234_9PLEO|nr:hypothetical protein OPT61_g7586 [Boeremia exigua]